MMNNTNTDNTATGENGRWPLPEGWTWTTLESVATLVGGGTPSRKIQEYFGGDIVWLTPTEIPKTGVSVISQSREGITELGLRKSSAKLVPKGTVLLTSRASIGYVAIAGTEVTTNQGFASFICNDGINSYYLAYWLKSIASDLEDRATGTTFKEISKSKLREVEFPLAPLPEQARIVAEIETQFTRLDTAVAALKRVQAGLARYKASVLKAAVEGRLVPQDPDDEPAGELLARILAERRAQWQAAHPGKKYVEPKGPDTAELGELPVGWVWATVEQVGEILGGLTKNQKRNAYPIRMPYLRVANVYANQLELDDVATIGVLESEISRTRLEKGDLLVVEGNGSKEQIGRVALWDGSIEPCLHQNHIIKVRFTCDEVNSFVLYWLLSLGGREQITLVASSTSGLYTLSLSKVASLPIPLPPLRQQRLITEELERQLSVLNATEQSLERGLARADRLRQAILQKAFRGELRLADS
jgi:type I restriction enzyme S subunit